MPSRHTVPVAMATLALALVVKPVERPTAAVLDTALVLMGMSIIRMVGSHVPSPGRATRRWGFGEFLYGTGWATAMAGTAAVWNGHVDWGAAALDGATVVAIAAAAISIDRHLQDFPRVR